MAATAVCEPATEPEVDLEDRVREICGQLNVAHAALVELAAELLETGAWQQYGVKSPAHWLTWQCGLSPRRAAEIVRLAKAKATHPQVHEAFSDGAISVDQAAVATKAPAYLDGDFAEFARTMTVTQLRLAVRAAPRRSLSRVFRAGNPARNTRMPLPIRVFRCPDFQARNTRG